MLPYLNRALSHVGTDGHHRPPGARRAMRRAEPNATETAVVSTGDAFEFFHRRGTEAVAFSVTPEAARWLAWFILWTWLWHTWAGLRTWLWRITLPDPRDL